MLFSLVVKENYFVYTFVYSVTWRAEIQKLPIRIEYEFLKADQSDWKDGKYFTQTPTSTLTEKTSNSSFLKFFLRIGIPFSYVNIDTLKNTGYYFVSLCVCVILLCVEDISYLMPTN